MRAVRGLLRLTPRILFVSLLSSVQQEKPATSAGNSMRLDVSELCDGISSVQITVSGADVSEPLPNGKPSRADLIRMKDLILSDASMEAS